MVGDGWDVLAARIDRAQQGRRLPSDHWPVVADVVLRRRPASPASPGPR